MSQPPAKTAAPAPRVTFDEQVWPINVALVVLAGFVAGSVVALSGFDDPRLLYNGWARLTTLAVSVGLLIFAVNFVDSRRLRRNLQLAIVLSCLFHVILMIVLYNQRVEHLALRAAEDDEASELADRETEVALPDYNYTTPDQPAQDFEQPVEVETPQPAPPTPVTREVTQVQDPVPETQPTPLPGATPEVQSRPVERPEMEQAAPRKGPQPGLLSRHMTNIDVRPGEAAGLPEANPGEQRGTAAVEAASTPIARQASELSARSASETPSPLPAPQQQTAQLARRDSDEPEAALASSVSTLPRQVNQPAAVPRSNVESPQVAGGLEQPTSMQPHVVVSRREMAGPQGFMQESPEPRLGASAEVGKLDVARADPSDQPRIASTPLRVLSRTPDETAIPATVAAAAPLVAAGVGDTPGSPAPVEGPASVVAPSPLAISRGETGAPAAAGGTPGGALSETAGPQSAAAAGPAVAGLQVAQADSSPTLSMNPGAASGRSTSRATIAAAAEASPVAVDSPAAGVSATGSEPQAAPANTALSKGSGGGFGGGNEANFGRGVSDTAQPATVGSMAASRPANLQNGPEGPALAPSGPALIGRSVAGAKISSAAFVATDDVQGVPDAVGAGRAGSIEASASASIQKANGKGQPGPVSAAAGSGQIDLGPTQIVASVGSGNAAGGGGGPAGPSGRLSGTATPLTRSGNGGAPLAALATTTVAAIPAAPPGEGGSGPAGSGGGSGTGGSGTGGSGSGGSGSGGSGSGGSGSGGSGGGNGNGGTAGVGPAVSIARVGGGSDLPAGIAPGSGPIVANAAGGGGTAQVAAGPVVRAEGGGAGDPSPGVASAGSSKLPSRSLGQTFVADTKADVPQLPAGPGGTDSPGTSPGQPGGNQAPVRSVAGLPGTEGRGPVGAIAGPTSVDSPIIGTPGLGVGPATASPAASPTNEQAPVVGNIATGGPLRRTNVAGLVGGQGIAGGTGAAIDVPALEGPAGSEPQAQPAGVAGGGVVGAPGRGTGSLPVQVAALDGPGGLGSTIAPDVGSLSRRAQRDSEVVYAGKDRFLTRTVGGAIKVDGKAREPARAFAGRGGQRLTKDGGLPNELPQRTEDSVELGLDFLARHQSPDGSWSFNRFGAGQPGNENEEVVFHSDAAATGLALLAFLGAGYDHYDDQYLNVVRGGLEFLIRNQKPNGDLYLATDAESNKSAWFYSHGIASIALCEAYGMTGDENLKAAAQKAIDFIVASQHPTRGGWRYAPQFDADTSVSGWQLMALKSGELAGLTIPPGTYDKVRKWLDSAQSDPKDASQYVYNPNAPNTIKQRHGRRTTTTMTAVGLLMRLYTGWDRNDPRMVAGAKHLMEHLPAIGTPADPQRDTYYWYYATQVMFHMKGDYWKAWNDRLRPLLLEKQIQTGPLAGSWDPRGIVPDKWGPKAGRIYVTTLNLLSLEVNYRHLPIYESEAK